MNIEDRKMSSWFKNQVLRKAILSSSISFLLFFIVLLWITHPYGWEWRGYSAFAFGTSSGILFMYFRLPNPYPFMTNRRDVLKLKLTQEEALEFLGPYWERFPRYFYCLAGVILIMLLLGITSIFGFKGSYAEVVFILALIFGFGFSIPVCGLIFFVYVYRILKTEDKA